MISCRHKFFISKCLVSQSSLPEADALAALESVQTRTRALSPKSVTIDCIPKPSSASRDDGVVFGFRRTQHTRSQRFRPVFHHCAVDHHHTSARRLLFGPLSFIRIHVQIHGRTVVVPRPHHATSPSPPPLKYLHAFLFLVQLLRLGFAIFADISFAAYGTSDMSRLM